MVIIGDNFHSGVDDMILTSNHNYDYGTRIPYDDMVISKDMVIGDNCWCGSRVILLPGTVLEEGVIIQAGSVVHGRIPRCAIIGGNPAKIIKYRDVEHYDELKNKGMFW